MESAPYVTNPNLILYEYCLASTLFVTGIVGDTAVPYDKLVIFEIIIFQTILLNISNDHK